jgi:HK97 family phage portal protein
MQMFGGKTDTGEIAWNNWQAQQRQYRGTPYACIRKIAPAIAAASLHLFIPEGSGDSRKFPSIKASNRIPVADEVKNFLLTRPHCKAVMAVNEGIEEIASHPALDVFNKANGSMTRSQLFEKLGMDMTLYGNEYWHPVMNKTEAYPAMIQVIQVGTIKPTEKDGIITGYKMRRRAPLPPKKFKLEEIVHFFYPNPYSISEGFSPISAASQRISGEVGISTVQNSTLTNKGIPAGLVKIIKRMTDEQFKDFKKEWSELYAGATNDGKIGFTQGDWEFIKLAQTLEEMGYIEGAKMLREFIANDLEVPISKLTMEASNRAVAEAGNTEFLRDAILPKLTMIAEELTDSMIPLFPALEGTDAFYMFDNPVPEDLRMKIMARRVNRTTGVTTPNDERQEDGREPHPSEEADQLAPVRAPMPEQSEDMAVRAIDEAFHKAMDGMRNGECDHEGD